MEIMASTTKLCDYTDLRAVVLKTKICRKWSVFANQIYKIVQQFAPQQPPALTGLTNEKCLAPVCTQASIHTSESMHTRHGGHYIEITYQLNVVCPELQP